MSNEAVFPPRRRGRLIRMLAGTALAGGLAAGFGAGIASAAPGEGSPSDPRAIYNPGNITICPSGVDVTGSLTFEGGTGTGSVTITAVAAGVTVTDIFVKGGPDYNHYEPGERGLPATPPWEDLISPLNNGGNIPAISHWFACGTSGNGTTTTTTSTTTSTTSTTSTTTTTVPGGTTTTTTQPGDTTTTTTTQPGDTTTTTTTQPGDTTTTTTTQPGDTTTTTTEPGATTTTTQPEGTTTTTQAGGTTTTVKATTTTTKLPTTGSNNVGAVIALALIALGAGGGAVVIARRNS